MERAELINLGKVITNLILIVMLIIVLITTLKYKAEVREAIGTDSPDRLIEIYEKQTGENCWCGTYNGPSLNDFSFDFPN